MLYKKFKNKIEIYDKSQFQPQHILECGQVFCFEQSEQGYTVFPGSHFAKIQEKDDCYQIFTTSADFFEEYFDLDTTKKQKVIAKCKQKKIYKAFMNAIKEIEQQREDVFFAGDTFLHMAANGGFSDVLIKALEIDPELAKIRSKYGGNTFLHYAARNGLSDVLIKALEVDPCIAKIQDYRGYTFLHYAAEEGFANVLIKALDTNPELLTIKTDKRQSVLDLAREMESKKDNKADFSEFFDLVDKMHLKEVPESIKNVRDLLNERKSQKLGEDRR